MSNKYYLLTYLLINILSAILLQPTVAIHLSVRPSVCLCLSNAVIVSKRMHIVTIFDTLGRGIVLVFEAFLCYKIQRDSTLSSSVK